MDPFTGNAGGQRFMIFILTTQYFQSFFPAHPVIFNFYNKTAFLFQKPYFDISFRIPVFYPVFN